MLPAQNIEQAVELLLMLEQSLFMLQQSLVMLADLLVGAHLRMEESIIFVLPLLLALATLLPQRAGGSHAGDPTVIAPANDQIRAMAAGEGAILVDVYQAFNGSPDPWIDADGLHPTVIGYQKMAETFFDAIRARFEQPPASSTARASGVR